MIDLAGKVAIVTGGANGIGAGICRVLAGQGATVAVADIDGDEAQSVASGLPTRGPEAMAVTADVTTEASVEAAVAAVLERLGQIDILVNNAGVVGAPGWWERPTPSDGDWDAVFAVNLRGVVRVSEAVAPPHEGATLTARSSTSRP